VEIQWNRRKPSVTAVRHAGLPGRAHVRACSARMSHQERDSFGSGTWVLPAYLSVSYDTHFHVDSNSHSGEKDRRAPVSAEDKSRSFAKKDSEEFHRLIRSSDRRSRRNLQSKMTIRRQDKMRHSSSWPDRAPQTVKVRVDPLSRAFTIIPTSHETTCQSEQTVSRSNRLEEVALVHRRETLEAVASVAIKQRLVDARSAASKRSANFNANTLDTSNERISINRCFMGARSLSSIEASVIRQNAILFEENVFRDQSRCKSDPLVRTNDVERTRDAKGVSELARITSDSDIRKSLPKGEREESADKSARQINESPLNRYPFDIRTNDVADDRARMAGAAQTSDSRARETDGARKKCQTIVSSACSPRHAASLPPCIKVVDYDDYVTSVSFLSRTGRHACPKCTSEGVLRSQIDPFCSPSPGKKNDDATTANARGVVRRADSIRRERKKAHTEPRADERQSKDTWHEEHLIGEVKNVDAKKSGQQRRNDDSPRPLADFRKEATLRRHYYPEGGWGYVVVTCSMLVHFLGVGLQLAAPGCWHTIAERQFKHPPLHSAGKTSSRCS